MKALLRSSIFAFVVFAGYTAFSTDLKAPLHTIPGAPAPTTIPCQTVACVK